MRMLLALTLSMGLVGAAEDETPLPPVEAVIAATVKELPSPAPVAMPKILTMAITASEPAAQKHVLDGIAHLHGGWDFEAYRHFCAALQLDPECLMAHWGVVVALASPEPDLLDERNASLRRMAELVADDAGTELERSYAYAIAVFFEKGSQASADAFRKVSEKYPNDPQLKLLMAAFGRSGYDEGGKAKPDQEQMESMLDEMLLHEPDHPLYLNAYLTIRAEAPDLRGDLARARRLCELAPDYPPFQHLRGHYELRSGETAQAVEAFAKASDLYRDWMKDSKVGFENCGGWVKAECYRATALALKGDYPAALAVAKSVAEIPVTASQVHSEGGRLLMWEGRTLAARLLMRRGAAGDAALALRSLPDPSKYDAKESPGHSVWFYQGLAFSLEARKALEAKNRDDARKLTDALTLHGERMSRSTRQAAFATGERSVWSRAYAALEICASELRGSISMAGPKDGIGTAYNWYRAALERQTPPPMVMAPIIALPMEIRLGEYHLARGEEEQASKVLTEAEGKFPGDLEVLTRLRQVLEKTGKKEEAGAIRERIAKIKAE